MAIICEECGKIYSIEPEKLNRLVEKKGKVRCTECGYVFTVTKPQKEAVMADIAEEDLWEDSSKDFESEIEDEAEAKKDDSKASLNKKDDDDSLFGDSDSSEVDFALEDTVGQAEETSDSSSQSNIKENKTEDDKKSKESGDKIKGLGLRGKMFILFLMVPLILMAISGLFSQSQITSLSTNLNSETEKVVQDLSTEINKKSTDVVKQLAEDNMAEKARAVALECKIYLDNHKELKKENFYDTPDFKAIALQSVGKTGYTVLVELAEKDEEVKIWIHETPMLIGVPAMEVLKQALGENWPHFYKSLIPAKAGKEIAFYYKWKEENGSIREKYMAVAPIKGTKYAILATTYIDEFTGPITKLKEYYEKEFSEKNKKLKLYAAEVTINSRNITFGILIGTLIIVSLTIIIYGHRITQAIKYLTIAADRISVGELETEIKIVSKDEIGRLAEAISRMQDSLRVSIERLRRRR